ncbi:MAG: GNAT family N-acetyltransferase [Clostridium sp.]|nr:GNAT family N-acetyltransferase [Clostridium sp.]
MEILKAVPEDAKDIYSIMMTAHSLLKDKGWYCVDTEDYVREHIENPSKGIVFKAVEHGETGAFFLIHLPGADAGNLGTYAGLKGEALLRCAHMDSMAVKPAFRGRRLQARLLAHGEAYLSSSRSYLFGTVHPDNTYSLNNFLKLGYKILTTTQKYGSLPRHILYKDISISNYGE